MVTADTDHIFTTALKRFDQDLLLVWLDENINDSSDILLAVSPLRQRTSTLHLFSELELAMTFLASIQYEQVLLIVSSTFAGEVLSRTQNLRTVQAVFIFDCGSPCQKINLDKSDSEVAIFSSQPDLLIALEKRIVTFQKQVFNFTIYDQMQRSTKDLSEESNAFLWYQVLFHVLRQMPTDEQAKEEMLQACSSYQRLSPNEERIIQEYRECQRQDQAIHWYTRATLIFKLLNQALRTEDMALIYQFRYLIQQLCVQIELEHGRQICDEQWTLYRGFQLHKEEFERLKKNVGGLISINSFFSTTRDKAVAIIFAGPGGSENQLVSVLMEVQVNPARLQSVFFADIQHLSAIPNETEVLFSLGSTFQIISVDFNDETQLWLIRLDVSDGGSDRIGDYCRLADHDLQERSPFTYFGAILTDNLDQPDRAVRYFRGLLQLLDRNHPNRIHIYELLGEAYSRKKDHSRAKKCFEKVRAIHRSQSNKTLECGNDVIVEDLRRKLDIEEKRTSEASLEKAKLMYQIGDLVETNETVLWLQRARETYEQLNLPNPSMSICLDDLAWTYRLDKKDEQNLDALYQRLAVDEQYLPPENQQLRDILEDIRGGGVDLDDDREFADFCQRSLVVLSKKHTDDHPRLVHMRRCMEEATAKIHQFERKQTELINIFEATATEDLAQLSWCLHEMATHYYCYSLYDQSVRYALEDLQINRKMYPNNHPNIISVLFHIAFCYNQLADYQQAFDYMKQVLMLYESSANVDADAITIIRDDIDKIVAKAAKHHIELPWKLHKDHDRCAKVEKSTEESNKDSKPVP